MLELIHTDLCDNKDYLTRGGKRYFINFTDDYSNTLIFIYLEQKMKLLKNLRSLKKKLKMHMVKGFNVLDPIEAVNID